MINKKQLYKRIAYNKRKEKLLAREVEKVHALAERLGIKIEKKK